MVAAAKGLWLWALKALWLRNFWDNVRRYAIYGLTTLEDGDIALFDMGAEYQFYGSDIT
ncbi:hypothetical protein IC582_019596 [Cucumis melo]